MPQSAPKTAVVIVDHGSRREESNQLLLQVVRQFRNDTEFDIVVPAHMELAGPTIAMAFEDCVDQGATRIIVFPYFLAPGRHWDQDIPRLAAEAAANHPGIEYLVTSPLGAHPLMSHIMLDRIKTCQAHALEGKDACSICSDGDKCQMRNA
jgi:sirohydrochlorin ferrochelatase